MISKRIIPCLDVRDGKLTKGIKFKGNVDIGDPVEVARDYYEQGADEIVFYDKGNRGRTSKYQSVNHHLNNPQLNRGVTSRIMAETLWRLARRSVRQPNCLSPKVEFSAVAQ